MMNGPTRNQGAHTALRRAGRRRDRLGLAKGTVYLYFRTKGAIFASILQDGWGEVISDLEGSRART